MFLTQQSFRSAGQLRVGWSQPGSAGWSSGGSSGLTHVSGSQLMWAWLGWVTLLFLFLCLVLLLGSVGQLAFAVVVMTTEQGSKSTCFKPFLRLRICYEVQILFDEVKRLQPRQKGRINSLPSGRNYEVTWQMVLIWGVLWRIIATILPQMVQDGNGRKKRRIHEMCFFFTPRIWYMNLCFNVQLYEN